MLEGQEICQFITYMITIKNIDINRSPMQAKVASQDNVTTSWDELD